MAFKYIYHLLYCQHITLLFLYDILLVFTSECSEREKAGKRILNQEQRVSQKKEHERSRILQHRRSDLGTQRPGGSGERESREVGEGSHPMSSHDEDVQAAQKAGAKDSIVLLSWRFVFYKFCLTDI